MPEITLTAEVGRPTGSSASGRLRADGKIPGVLYGHGMDPLSLAVNARELRGALNTEAGTNALLTLKLSDGGEHLALAKDIQRHPVRNTVIHVDFLVVSADEEVVSDVTITLTGEATNVRREGGVVAQPLTSLAVRSKATQIPTGIEVDISDLNIGDTIRVSDLSLPSGVTTDIDGEEPVVVGQPPAATAAESPEEPADEAEAEAAAAGSGEAAADQPPAGEAGEPADGQAPDNEG